MNVIYLQCDSRFNKWLLKKIGSKYVVQHTIERCMKIGGKETYDIVSGIYDCPENSKLASILNEQGVHVKISCEEDVNKRFLESIMENGVDYVVRVGGDQCLIDSDAVTSILESMKENAMEWFYEDYANCILPDIISARCLKKWNKELRCEDRYFKVLERQVDIKRYRLHYPICSLFNFRVNSNESFRVCSAVITNNLDVYKLSQKLQQCLTRSAYLVDTGLLGSWLLPLEINEFYYNENKKINPWWNRSIIDFVKKYLNKSLSVFEWGSGNSTLFWSQYVKEVVSVEHNKQWYEKMQKVIPDNVLLKYCELEYGGVYSNSILNEKREFEIILIDGRDRVRCAKNSVMRLKENGIIIWDNSDREVYKLGVEYLKQHGFKQLEIGSVVYGLPGREEFTSIFYRENNLFGL